MLQQGVLMPKASKTYFQGATPLILAHRGLALAGIQENTLAAFSAALDAGATHLESDVQATSDGFAVLFHDDTLRRIYGRSERISDLTLEQLRELASERNRVPTLKEALEAFPTARFNLDIKTADAVVPAVKALAEDSNPQRFLVSSFSRRRRLQALKALKARGIQVATSADAITLLILKALFSLRLRFAFAKVASSIDALQVPVRSGWLRFDSPAWINWVRDVDLELHYWTINERKPAERLVVLGATGIVTDRCDLLADLGNKKS
jgi:glycerophosphoryl diester phosphodiesterase